MLDCAYRIGKANHLMEATDHRIDYLAGKLEPVENADERVLRGIVQKLDYLQELGFETLWISPFFASPQADLG